MPDSDPATTHLLSSILSELQSLNTHHPQTLIPHTECTTCHRRRPVSLPPPPQPHDPHRSIPTRLGPLLHEALRRHRLDSVPHWSTFYGAHFTPPTTLPTALHAPQQEQWPPLPHDNRVTLHFLPSSLSPGVEQFLSTLHADDQPRRGRFVNVWDWFDGGLSAFWFPGRGVGEWGRGVEERGRVEGELALALAEGKGEVVDAMVAPWRRVMCVSFFVFFDAQGG